MIEHPIGLFIRETAELMTEENLRDKGVWEIFLFCMTYSHILELVEKVRSVAKAVDYDLEDETVLHRLGINPELDEARALEFLNTAGLILHDAVCPCRHQDGYSH